MPFHGIADVYILTLLAESDKFMARVFEDAISAVQRIDLAIFQIVHVRCLKLGPSY